MATLKFNGKSYSVDHAVKGPSYVHGYDSEGNCVVSINGVSNFSSISYDSTYMLPSDCLEDPSNAVKYCGGTLKTSGGVSIPASAVSAATSAELSSEIARAKAAEQANAKAAAAAQATAAAAQNTANAAMPKSGGLFTGVVTLASQNYTGGCGRNILVQNNVGTANVSTQYIIMQRK